MRHERFGLVLTSEEKEALRALAAQERLPAAAVVRRLIWRAAQRINFPSSQELPVETDAEEPWSVVEMEEDDLG